MGIVDRIYSVKGEGSYLDVLQAVQEYMKHVNGFNTDELTDAEVMQYKKHIESCITTQKLKCNEVDTLSGLIDRLYNTMVLYDVLTEYLKPETYTVQGIEEIYGRWDCIYLLSKQGKVRLKEKFPSAEIALDIFQRIVQRFNCTLNEGTPLALGEFCPNVRASFAAPPITSPKYGTEFNIRIVHGSSMTRDLLIGTRTVSEKGLDFLELCVKHSVSICISGATGSGKTGTMYYLLSTVTQDKTYRVGTIEIESREFDLIKYGVNDERVNDVFHWVTRSSEDDRYNISANDLVETVLRFKPDIVGIGEMRNKEALIACELATTGHGVVTTTHCDSAAKTPSRILQLCKKGGSNYDDGTLMKLIADAFPIIVYQRLEMDGRSRKIYEIAECFCDKDGTVKVNNLFEYIVTDNQVNTKTTIGAFKQVGTISEALRQRLLRNGAPMSEINKYCEVIT